MEVQESDVLLEGTLTVYLVAKFKVYNPTYNVSVPIVINLID
jgi:hypothetical protein